MFAFLLGALALAAPPGAAPQIPTGSASALQGVFVGGLDAWTGGGGAGAEARLDVWGAGETSALSFVGGYGGLVGALSDVGFVDGHVAALQMRRRGVFAPGVAVTARGGALIEPVWGEASAVALLGARARTVSAEMGFGPGFRGDFEEGAAGVVGTVSLRSDRPFTTIGLSSSLRAYRGDLPPLSVDVSAEATQRSRIATVGLRGGISWVAESDAEGVPRAGFSADGSTVASVGLQIRRPVARGISIGIEGAIESAWGSVAYTRGRALAGFWLSRERARSKRPDPPRASGARFELRAPRASSVSLIASCAAWAPVPMERGPTGTWSVQLPLAPGECEYAYLVDGVPRTPPEALQTRSDGFGGTNGVLTVVPD